MSLRMVVPVRSLREGKSRLAPALDVAERAALVKWLLVHTLEQAAAFPGLNQTFIVSACADARALAANRGARVLEEHAPGGLNSALRQAQSAVASLGASRMLVLSCDLPLVQVEDLRRLADAASDTIIALAPDRTDEGTNAICLPASRPFDFAFGPDSFSRHRKLAQVLGLESVIIRTPGLAFDVDLPVHLSELHRLRPWLHPTVLGGNL
jgi:2-phospho-L-lactate/phosphoenolpyruvate guanylyltransferase